MVSDAEPCACSIYFRPWEACATLGCPEIEISGALGATDFYSTLSCPPHGTRRYGPAADRPPYRPSEHMMILLSLNRDHSRHATAPYQMKHVASVHSNVKPPAISRGDAQ